MSRSESTASTSRSDVVCARRFYESGFTPGAGPRRTRGAVTVPGPPMQRPTPAAARRARDTALATRLLALPDDEILAAWRRLRPLVRLILWKMLGSDEEVRDLLQEAFLQFNRSV